MPQYFDIGVNLTDPMFAGVYNRKQYHAADLAYVFERAQMFNISRMLVTGSSLKESAVAMEITKQHPAWLFSTVGVHPCSVTEFVETPSGGSAVTHMEELKQLALEGKRSGHVKAFGEIGLDYDRFHYAPKELQIEYFRKQLDVACDVGLPLFLHMRAACDDFIDIIEPYYTSGKLTHPGVVHSFTGTLEELRELLRVGFYIGINGCSLKTQENLDVVAQIPLDRLMLETDAPWCEVRPSHAGYRLITKYPNKAYPEIPQESNDEPTEEIAQLLLECKMKLTKKPSGPRMDEFLPLPSLKREQVTKHMETLTETISLGEKAPPLVRSRNEPCLIGFVAEIVASVQGKEVDEVISRAWDNSCKVFGV
ncbi:hypothetical protein BABINDRAFT_38033 [Babjeviella inositovora NRRL Y-12698]|uniref:Uncharacterized protein n=1 Tax=Babjeviella inositovora NRRL Y-12698 TaxID=984486 RepID=A0A1E3QNF7_9ASCO|nr:uncharacterized protein BABINDRAFT_38033 [Babjeviella inositovora NRRL Y-12698]ODQ79215.1 hypothetical protein BABINDRAFT_38033 [Babjeviella inositovora NRRL Y-12698]